MRILRDTATIKETCRNMEKRLENLEASRNGVDTRSVKTATMLKAAAKSLAEFVEFDQSICEDNRRVLVSYV